MADKWNFNPDTEELEPADKETLAHDLPRIVFEKSYGHRICYMRAGRREAAHRGTLPSLRLCIGVANLCDVLLRHGVYFAVWRARTGAAVFLDVFDGDDKVRYECTSQSELQSAIYSAAEEFNS